MYHFSLSNGVEFASLHGAENWTVEPTMNSLRAFSIQCWHRMIVFRSQQTSRRLSRRWSSWSAWSDAQRMKNPSAAIGRSVVGYIEKNLVAGEKVLYRTRLHWIVLIWPLLAGGGVWGGGLVVLV